MSRLILASASPRRKELLEQAGAVFEIIPAKGEEIITKKEPHEVVMELALQKAKEVAAHLTMVHEKVPIPEEKVPIPEKGSPIQNEACMILGADTVVVYDGKILGKPGNREEAAGMLTALSGNTHSVYTGVAVIRQWEGREQIWNFYEETKVAMYPMSPAEIESYLNYRERSCGEKDGAEAGSEKKYRYEWEDKAGAYAIQGKCAIYIEKIMGDYNNVVGLPIARIYREMLQSGIDIYGNL